MFALLFDGSLFFACLHVALGWVQVVLTIVDCFSSSRATSAWARYDEYAVRLVNSGLMNAYINTVSHS
jgi:hypothetical protein